MSQTVEFDVSHAAHVGKTWLAQLTGLDPRMGFQREFIGCVARNTSRSGETGTYTYLVSDGLYESQGRHGRCYWEVMDGESTELERADVVKRLSQ